MAPLFLILVSLLIVGGVVVNLYLYSRGAVGSGTQRLHPANAGATGREATIEDLFYTRIGETTDDGVRYARVGLLVILSAVLVLGFILLSALNAFPH
jgi:hypothetical protein